MSYKHKHAFVFTGVTKDAREIIVDTFREFDWEEGLDVNTETVCVLDYVFVDRENARLVSELSPEKAEKIGKKFFDNHLEQWDDNTPYFKTVIKRIKELLKWSVSKDFLVLCNITMQTLPRLWST